MTAPISGEMPLLDIVAEHRETEKVFNAYNCQAGTCLMCNHLFDTLAEVCRLYGLDMEKILLELNRAANQ